MACLSMNILTHVVYTSMKTYCRYRILSTLNLHAEPEKFQKY